MSFDTSTSDAYAILYSVLGVFAILAILSGGWFFTDKLPSWLVMQNKQKMVTVAESKGSDNEMLSTDFFLSARGSTGTAGIALSFFASGMGAWVVYGTTEMGASPQLSWLAVLGYSFGSAFPGIVICALGPRVLKMCDTRAFCTTDYARQRYGRLMQLAVGALSVFYMWIYLVAELTSISNIYALIVGKPTFPDLNKTYTTGIAVSIGVITLLYTTIAGVPASILTDKFQGAMMMSLVIILTIAVTASSENHVSKAEFDVASNFDIDGFYAAVTLVIAILSAEMFNQANWQRVWAADSENSLKRGFGIGSFMIFCLMMFFGVMGMIGYAKEPEAYDNFEKFNFLAFFNLLEPLPEGWHVLVLITVTALAASSVDSLQNGITSIVNRDLIKFGFSPTKIKWISRLLLVGVNAAAIIKSSERYDVLSLFLVADLACATSVFPVFMGLLGKEESFFAPTEFGALMGCVGGLLAVLVNGLILYPGENPFDYFWLRNGAACALCGTKTMWTFIITPLVSIASTVIFSRIDILVRGEEKAYAPLIPIPNGFDETDTTVEVTPVDDKDEA